MKIQFSHFSRAIATLFVLFYLSAGVLGDTVKLKNGSVIKGKVVSYGQGEFTIILDLGSSTRRSTSRMIIASEDIESIEFDSAEPSQTASRTEQPRETVREASAPPPQVAAPVPETVAPPPTATVAPEERTGSPSSSPLPVVAEKEIRVAAAADWTSTEIRIVKGQRIVIEASGDVDLGGAQRSGPNGIPRTDSRKLMANRPTGALIAVIGDDNDNFVFVGKETDFTATNSGILFLSINEGDLRDNSGSFIARVKVLGMK